jgi:phosphoribosylaminoimidazolecarboxamide formyltransferase / IMP cyclohydrolase
MKKKRILISVTDKTDIEKFKKLVDIGWEVLSTGGTADYLKSHGIDCILIEEITGFPEMMNGRLKTLHPYVFGGILADRSKEEHMAAIEAHGIQPIDIVVVNLYAFDKKPGIENIDIGGPSLLRAAAKNVKSVAVIVDPGDYDMVIEEVETAGEVHINTRQQLAMRVFRHTSAYDTLIAEWMLMENLAKRTFS